MVREVLKQEHHLEFEDMFNYFFQNIQNGLST